MFENIKIIIWDFDGTLYKPIQKLWQDVREAEYRVLMDYTSWSKDKAISEFNKNYKVTSPSATETIAILAKIKTAKVAVEMEKYYDRRKYLKKDKKLIKLFKNLSHYQHFILANGAKQNIVAALKVLGLNPDIFSEIVTSETVGVNKPHLEGFQYILKKTKLPAAQHVMIGDRESVDLEPAKKLGMKTCLLWSDELSRKADITFKSVYDLEDVL